MTSRLSDLEQGGMYQLASSDGYQRAIAYIAKGGAFPIVQIQGSFSTGADVPAEGFFYAQLIGWTTLGGDAFAMTAAGLPPLYHPDRPLGETSDLLLVFRDSEGVVQHTAINDCLITKIEDEESNKQPTE